MRADILSLFDSFHMTVDISRKHLVEDIAGTCTWAMLQSCIALGGHSHACWLMHVLFLLIMIFVNSMISRPMRWLQSGSSYGEVLFADCDSMIVLFPYVLLGHQCVGRGCSSHLALLLRPLVDDFVWSTLSYAELDDHIMQRCGLIYYHYLITFTRLETLVASS